MGSRSKKYLRKLEHLDRAVDLLGEWVGNTPKETFLTDMKTKYASYKAFQEATEVAMDLCAMITKDEGRITKDDYSNIETLVELKIISERLAEKLKECNSLRNWIVHRYNKLDDKIAYDRIKSLMDSLIEFSEVVKGWLERRF